MPTKLNSGLLRLSNYASYICIIQLSIAFVQLFSLLCKKEIISIINLGGFMMKGKSRSNFLVLIAIFMMVSSAAISYFLVRANEPRIDELRLEIQSKQISGRDLWNNINKRESKLDIAIIISLLDKKNLHKYVPEFESKNIDLSLKDFGIFRQSNIDRINKLYMEEKALEAKILELKRESKIYSDIAFFLQIFGLIIIILKKDTSF